AHWESEKNILCPTIDTSSRGITGHGPLRANADDHPVTPTFARVAASVPPWPGITPTRKHPTRGRWCGTVAALVPTMRVGRWGDRFPFAVLADPQMLLAAIWAHWTRHLLSAAVVGRNPSLVDCGVHVGRG